MQCRWGGAASPLAESPSLPTAAAGESAACEKDSSPSVRMDDVGTAGVSLKRFLMAAVLIFMT